MSSAAMDKNGNIALGFSISGAQRKPGIHYTGRLSTDALNTMTQGEGVFVDGNGVQTGGLSRWGDYSSMSVDPIDGCTFWYANEYIPANGSFNWRTRMSSIKFPGCGVAANDFSISANPTTVTVNPGSSGPSTISTAVVSGAAETIALSATGLPAGASAAFNPTSVPAGSSSTLTLSTTASTPPGTYSITVTGTAPSATHSTTVMLTVNGAGGGIVNGTFESGNLTGWTQTGVRSVTSTNPHSGSFAALLGSASPSAQSTLLQTFTVPAGATQLSLFYLVACPDVVANDFATVRLKDNVTNTSTNILANTCTNNGMWTLVTANVIAGRSYTLTLANKDNGAAGTATSTRYDDVALS
jgi:hypothetical protein